MTDDVVSPARKAIQAKHVPDAAYLRAVLVVQQAKGPVEPGGRLRWASLWDVEPAFPDVPWKVLLAKARALIRRGLLDGCPCGCRGDLELTADGQTFLHSAAASGSDASTPGEA